MTTLSQETEKSPKEFLITKIYNYDASIREYNCEIYGGQDYNPEISFIIGEIPLTRIANLEELVRIYEYSVSKSISRSDDFGDSYCSAPIREAKEQVRKLREEK